MDESGIREGMVLVSAMHITAGVWVNDDEPGIQADALEWLDKLAPPSWRPPANDVARQLLPDGGDYRHHRGGEDNGDAHLKNLLVHHQVVVPVTDGRLDLGPWQADLLLRVRRPPQQAAGHQGVGRVRTGLRAGGGEVRRISAGVEQGGPRWTTCRGPREIPGSVPGRRS